MIKKILSVTTLWISGLSLAYAAPSSDATVSTIVDGLIPQLDFGSDFHTVIYMMSYLIGLFLAYKGVVMLKDIGDRGAQKKPITTPLVLLVCASMLIALPTLVNTGITTLGFDKSKQETFKY